jgi:hypothetical protein
VVVVVASVVDYEAGDAKTKEQALSYKGGLMK